MLIVWNNDKEMASQLTEQLECLTRARIFSDELAGFWYFKLQVKWGNAYPKFTESHYIWTLNSERVATNVTIRGYIKRENISRFSKFNIA